MIYIYIYAGSWNVESPSRLSRLAFAKFGIFESVRNLWKKLYRTDLKISEWEHQQSQCDMMHQHREQRKKWGNFARPCRMCIESIRRLDSMPSEPAEAAAKVDPKEQELDALWCTICTCKICKERLDDPSWIPTFRPPLSSSVLLWWPGRSCSSVWHFKLNESLDWYNIDSLCG